MAFFLSDFRPWFLVISHTHSLAEIYFYHFEYGATLLENTSKLLHQTVPSTSNCVLFIRFAQTKLRYIQKKSRSSIWVINTFFFHFQNNIYRYHIAALCSISSFIARLFEASEEIKIGDLSHRVNSLDVLFVMLRCVRIVSLIFFSYHPQPVLSGMLKTKTRRARSQHIDFGGQESVFLLCCLFCHFFFSDDAEHSHNSRMWSRWEFLFGWMIFSGSYGDENIYFLKVVFWPPF